jgi:hypothetical protein
MLRSWEQVLQVLLLQSMQLQKACARSSLKEMRQVVRRPQVLVSKTIWDFRLASLAKELAALAEVQAQKFGARLVISTDVTGLECVGDTYFVRVAGGKGSRHVVWSWPQALAIASWIFRITGGLNASASTTLLPPWNRPDALVKK